MNKNNIFTTIAYVMLILFAVSLILLIVTPVAAQIWLDEPEVQEAVVETAPVATEAPTTPHYDITALLTNHQHKHFNTRKALDKEVAYLESYIETLTEAKLSGNYEDSLTIINYHISFTQQLIDRYEIDAQKFDYTLFDVPSQYRKNDFKSFEDYRQITSTSSPHYELQREHARTGTYGIRMVDGRFCIALGSYFTEEIGQYVDIILENGTVIPCILGDQKADAHTDALHIAHRTDGSVVEFIVDRNALPERAQARGNISYCCDEWNSPVVQIKVYNNNYFEN
jgi:hypothetical protein